jgi:hypothetical protein
MNPNARLLSLASTEALQNRGGWGQSGVMARVYIQEAAASDRVIGRASAMLDSQSLEFATFPPHWTRDAIESGVVRRAVQRVFPVLDDKFFPVASFVLAHLVFHYDGLRNLVPATSPVLGSVSLQEVARELKGSVACGLRSDVLQRTGAHQLTAVLLSQKREFDEVRAQLEAVAKVAACAVDLVRSMPEDVSGRVTGSLEACARSLGHVTPSTVMDTFRQLFESELRPIHELLHVRLVSCSLPGAGSPVTQPGRPRPRTRRFRTPAGGRPRSSSSTVPSAGCLEAGKCRVDRHILFTSGGTSGRPSRARR